MDVPRLHPDTIEQVKQATDIVEIVSEHVVLRKQGRDLAGSCPFHEDKSPSFPLAPASSFTIALAVEPGATQSNS
jgi:DNA primase